MITHTRVRQFIRKIGITAVMSLFLGGLILGQLAQDAAAQVLPQGTSLIADDRQAGDYFGEKIDISGDYAIMGAPGSDTLGQDAGAAYIFHFNGTDWIQQAKLLANNGQTSDAFGRDVSIAGDYALVGASGKAYLFKRTGTQWVQTAAVTHNNPNFGYSVALSGQYAIVGAPDLDNGTAETGSAVLYERTGDTLVVRQELTVANLPGDCRVGVSVAISGTHAVVGVPTGDSGNPGAAYIFMRNGAGWQNTQTVHPSTNSFDNWYGIAIDMSNDLLIVGSQYHQHIAHVYKQHPDGSWNLDAELKPQNGQPTGGIPEGPVFGNLHFGYSVSISGQYALVGDPRAALTIPNQIYEGAAYLYNRVGDKNWQQVAVITEQVTNFFALSVALSETHVMVGASRSLEAVASYPLSATAAYTIQGTVLDANTTGVEGVHLTGLPSNTVTDAQGKYAVTVLEGWSGSVTPEKRGYQFSPATTAVPALTANKTLAFTATPLPQRTLTVSTDTTAGGGSVTTTGGALGQGTVLNGTITLYDGEEVSVDVTADADSSLKEVIVDGAVVFAGQPGSYSHTFTIAGGNHTIQATFWKTSLISGTLTSSDPNDPGLDTITICMSPQAPPLPECVSNFAGSYSIAVPRGWSGSIKAVSDAYTFVPAEQQFTNVTEFMVKDVNITATPKGPIVSPTSSHYVLETRDGQAAVWEINIETGQKIQAATFVTPAGWSAESFHYEGNNQGYLMLAKLGYARFIKVDLSTGQKLSTSTLAVPADWEATSFQAIGNNRGYLLVRRTGKIRIWLVDLATGQKISYTAFTIRDPWRAESFHYDGNGVGQLLTSQPGKARIRSLQLFPTKVRGNITSFTLPAWCTATSFWHAGDDVGYLLGYGASEGKSRLWEVTMSTQGRVALATLPLETGWKATSYDRVTKTAPGGAGQMNPSPQFVLEENASVRGTSLLGELECAPDCNTVNIPYIVESSAILQMQSDPEAPLLRLAEMPRAGGDFPVAANVAEQPVPEPSTFMLITVGLLGLGSLWRKNRRK